MSSNRLAECQRVIGYWFASSALIEMALTHSSVRTPDRECNERQEFLGDSVLGLVITEELYKRLPDQDEGELTRIKSAVVSRGALYRVSTRLGLPRFVEVAKGVGRREELPVSVTANLVESIIGAIYLDAGFFPAREFILRNLGPELDDVLNDRVAKNYKSLLQQECQKLLGVTPTYRTVEEEGPDHRKAFVVAALIRGQEHGRAHGINKKEAEQEAARHALEALQRRGRGRRRRSDVREGREGREHEVRPIARQSHDEESWKSWAERPSQEPRPASPAGAAPSGGFGSGIADDAAGERGSIGPEPEEAWGDESSARTPSGRGTGEPAGVAGGDDVPAAGSVAPSEAEGEREGGGRRRRRRGGRGRRGRGGDRAEAGPASEAAAVPTGEAPREAPGEERAPVADPGEPSEGAAPASSEPAPPPVPEVEPRRRRSSTRERGERRGAAAAGTERAGAGRTGEGRGAARAPRASSRAAAPRDAASPVGTAPAGTPAAAAPSSAAPAAPAPAGGRGFGEGVLGGEPPPAPVAVEKAVTKVGGVQAKKKAPKIEAPPETRGGFGTGL